MAVRSSRSIFPTGQFLIFFKFYTHVSKLKRNQVLQYFRLKTIKMVKIHFFYLLGKCVLELSYTFVFYLILEKRAYRHEDSVYKQVEHNLEHLKDIIMEQACTTLIR